MKTTIDDKGFIDYWFTTFHTNYRGKFIDPKSNRKRNITKPYFASLVGFNNFTELLAAWQSAENRYKFHITHLKDANEKAIKYYMDTLLEFSEPDKSVSEKLLLGSVVGDVAQADLDYYLSADKGSTKDIPVSLLNHLKEHYTNDVILNSKSIPEFDLSLIQERFLSGMSAAAKIYLVHLGISLKQFSDTEFLTIFDYFLELMESGEYFDTTWHHIEAKQHYLHGEVAPKNNVRRETLSTNGFISEALRRGTTTIPNLIGVIKRHAENVKCNSSSRSTDAYKIVTSESSMDIISVKILMRYQPHLIDKPSKEALNFYVNHCTIPSIQKKEPTSVPYGWETSKDSTVDISSMLTNSSDLGAPVLATYMLYNLAELDFSIERLFACLYAIGKNEILKPLCDQLEVIQSVTRTKSYRSEQLTNPLVAAFILINKASSFGENQKATADYYDFLRDLVTAKQYELLLVETSRYIEKSKLAFEVSIYLDVVEIALSKMSLKAIDNLDNRIKRAAFFTAARHGVILTETLANHLTKDDIIASEILSNPMYATFSNMDTKATKAIIRNVRQIQKTKIGFANVLRGDQYIHFEELVYCLASANAQVFDVNISEPFKRRLKWARTNPERVSRRAHYRPNNLVPEAIPQEIKVFKRYIESYDISAYEIYRLKQETNLRKSDIVLQDSDCLCCAVEEKLVICGFVNEEELCDLLKTHKSNSALFIDYEGLIGSNWGNEDIPYIASGNDILIKVPQVEVTLREFYDDWVWAREYINSCNLEGVNPLEKTINSLAPMYGYNGITINASGKDYTST